MIAPISLLIRVLIVIIVSIAGYEDYQFLKSPPVYQNLSASQKQDVNRMSSIVDHLHKIKACKL
jgi:hypothetical protein